MDRAVSLNRSQLPDCRLILPPGSSKAQCTATRTSPDRGWQALQGSAIRDTVLASGSHLCVLPGEISLSLNAFSTLDTDVPWSFLSFLMSQWHWTQLLNSHLSDIFSLGFQNIFWFPFYLSGYSPSPLPALTCIPGSAPGPVH